MTFCSSWAGGAVSIELGNACSVASLASRRCRFVKEHWGVIHHFLQRVTCRASHILMASFERKLGLVVIEERGPPLVVVMAPGAVVGAIAELIGVGILVASGACLRGARKVDMHQRQLQIRGLVAVGAGYRTMRAEEWKICLSVVEFRKIFPVFGGVACLATERLPCRTGLLHAFRELTLVNVLMTCRAVELAEVVRD